MIKKCVGGVASSGMIFNISFMDLLTGTEVIGGGHVDIIYFLSPNSGSSC
jgi:hypothetical protein